MKQTSIWGADFETTGKENLEKDGKIRVWLWSLVSTNMKQEYYGTEIDTFIDKIKELINKMKMIEEMTKGIKAISDLFGNF